MFKYTISRHGSLFGKYKNLQDALGLFVELQKSIDRLKLPIEYYLDCIEDNENRDPLCCIARATTQGIYFTEHFAEIFEEGIKLHCKREE